MINLLNPFNELVILTKELKFTSYYKPNSSSTSNFLCYICTSFLSNLREKEEGVQS